MKILLVLISLNFTVMASEVSKEQQKPEQKVEKKLSYTEQAKINKQKAKEAEFKRAQFKAKFRYF